MINLAPDTIVDSDMSAPDILAQNPNSPAPQSVLDALEILPVAYIGFDGTLHSGQIVMHRDVMSDVAQFFALAYAMRFPIQQVIPISNNIYRWDDGASCNDNNSSGYNYRLVAGTTRMSNHAAGLAFDINPVQNVYIQYDEHMRERSRFPKDAPYDVTAPGTLTSDHQLVTLMKDLGWDWGGDWTPASGRVDYQHFEK